MLPWMRDKRQNIDQRESLRLSNHLVNKQFAHILSNALRIKMVIELSKLVLLLFAALTCNCHWKQG